MKQLIRQGGDPVLRQVCSPVPKGENLDGLMALMERACKKSKIGVGLAAPQVGVTKRVIYTIVSRQGTVRGRFFVNPEIIELGSETDVKEEGCLSYPGIYKLVRRATSILLRFEDERRVVREERVAGFEARVVAHEVDHLNGICLIGDPDFLGDEPDSSPSGSSVSPAILAAVVGSLALS